MGLRCSKSEAHNRFPSVAAEGGCFAVRCVSSLNGPARGKAKGKSGLADQRGPRIIRAGARRQGEGGLRPRYAHWAKRSLRSYCCQQARTALGSSGYGLEGVFIMAWLPALVSPDGTIRPTMIRLR